MPRLREVPRSEVASEFIFRAYDRMFGPGRDPVAEPGTATGTPGNWWTCFANSPEVLHHAVAGFSLYQKSADRLDPVLRELGQTRAGWLSGSQFVFSQHCKSCRKLGMSDEQILDLTYITAMYAMHATLSRALRLEHDDRDEPVQEIAAPSGSAGRDIGADLAGG